jgi:hypothetical protein
MDPATARSIAKATDVLEPGRRVQIRYRNAEGEESLRTIRVRRSWVGTYWASYIRAFCELRGEERTFRVSRVLAVREVPEEPPLERAPGTMQRGEATAREKAGESSSRARGKSISRLVLAVLLLVAGWRIFNAPGYQPPPEVPQIPILTGTTPSPASAGDDGRELSTAVRARYAAADANGDGSLSWKELSFFQQDLVADIPYEKNSTALSPDAFLAAGSGDCEDFAIFTCGLLRYWGIDCYVASLSPGGKHEVTGHAVALIPVASVPEGFVSISHGSADSARYVPVDYEYVGALSTAVGTDWKLRWVRNPEEVYGRRM